MKKHITPLCALLILTVVLSCGCSTTKSARHTWEYRILQGVPRQEEFQQKLNAAASEGYTIDSTTFIPGDAGTLHQMVFVMKRKKP